MTSREPTPGQPGEPDQPDEIEWSFEDPDALWWDDVWPFRDDTVAEPAADGNRDLDLALAGPAEPVDEASALMSLLPAEAGADQDDAWWNRRFVWVSAVAAASVVVAGLLVLGRGQGHDDEARLLQSPAYSSPVALAPDTSYVRSHVLRSGHLVVTHWIRTSASVDSVEIAAPLTVGLTPDSVRVTHVKLAADGTSFPTASRLNLDSGTETLFFPATQTVYLRYRLSGTVQHTGPGRRALARLISLDVVPGDDSVATTQVVTGAKVLALACTSGPVNTLPTSSPVPCGSDSTSDWLVHLSPGLPTRVMAQVDLS